MLDIESLLDKDAHLLSYECRGIDKAKLHLPGPDVIDRIWQNSDRKPAVLRNLNFMLGHGRLANTGYINILPVDQGVEHSCLSAFAKNIDYFDPENIFKLAIEGGCSALASTLGVLSIVARKYAHRLPLILKLNHNETLSYPISYDQTMFAKVKSAFDMGCVGVGATIYWGSLESRRQLEEIKEAFYEAHNLGLFCILWCYLRNESFKKDGVDYHAAADLTSQANHLGVSLGADIIKQKLPDAHQGYIKIGFGHTSDLVYKDLINDNPIELTRLQVASCYMGRIGLINSGGPSGKDDIKQALLTAVINKRAGGIGLICGRKAFQRPLKDGIKILHAIQDVYLDKRISIA